MSVFYCLFAVLGYLYVGIVAYRHPFGNIQQPGYALLCDADFTFFVMDLCRYAGLAMNAAPFPQKEGFPQYDVLIELITTLSGHFIDRLLNRYLSALGFT